MYMAVFPEYIFPMTSSLAFLCWVAPETIQPISLDLVLVEWGFLIFPLIGQISPRVLCCIRTASSTIRCVCSWGMDIDPSCQMGDLSSYPYGLMSNSLF